jgi:hypothetical protein
MTTRPPSQATRLRALVAQAQLEVCHTPDNDVWAIATIDGRLQALPVMAPELGAWMGALYQQHEGAVVAPDALRAVVSTLRGAGMMQEATPEQAALIAGQPPAASLVVGESQATALVRLVEKTPGVELFHSPEGTPHVRLDVEGVRQVWPLRVRAFRSWLGQLYYDEAGKSPGGQAVQDALLVLEGKALFRGPEEPVFVRTAAPAGDVVWLDLGGEDRTAVRVTRRGWELVPHDRVEVAFVRPPVLRPLPRPVRDGGLDAVSAVMNLPKDGGRELALGWVLGTLAPKGPYLVLVLVGEQGSAKTFTARALRWLVDPAEPDLRGRPREERDVIVAARLNRVCAFDNFSAVRQEISDELARLATGTGFGARTLYTDLEETTFAGARPILLNGIGMPVTSADLLDRAAILDLPRLEEAKYLAEDALWQSFHAAHPAALGLILDGAARALADAATITPPPGRMADAARWIKAGSPALGWPATGEGSFERAYVRNRRTANRAAVEASAIGEYILQVAYTGGGFAGTATALLERLNGLAGEGPQRDKEWPKTAQALGQLLVRLAPGLRRLGVEASRGHERTGSVWTIPPRPVGNKGTEAVTPLTGVTEATEGDGGDRRDSSGPSVSSSPRGCSRCGGPVGVGTVCDACLDEADRSP